MTISGPVSLLQTNATRPQARNQCPDHSLFMHVRLDYAHHGPGHFTTGQLSAYHFFRARNTASLGRHHDSHMMTHIVQSKQTPMSHSQ